MLYTKTIQRVREELNNSFHRLNEYFDLPEDVRRFQPEAGVWSIDEILEHITLTNHYLMLTLRASRDKALRRSKTQPVADGESDLDMILKIGDPDAFDWIRPEHMEPTRAKPLAEIRKTMQEQHTACLGILSQISHGEGALHKVRMSVQNLGKLDMYQWLYFLIQHANRHMVEMERIKERCPAKPQFAQGFPFDIEQP